MKSPDLSDQDFQTLEKLEESLWIAETRFDVSYMEKLLASDMAEIGRSGRIYTRNELLLDGNKEGDESIDAKLPLENLSIRLLADDIAQVTYNSHASYVGVVESAHRSSIWSRSNGNWVLRFHQGTPYKSV